MSIHSSLRISGAGRGNRNVFTRIERLAVLKREGRWDGEADVLGLPKVRTRFKSKVKKAAKVVVEGEAAAAPAEGEAGAAAAAGTAAAPAAADAAAGKGGAKPGAKSGKK
ncbi:MAG: small basic protein [Planctomycetes bacterium]|nr:small basic protein [Planctomycetota bacterium]